MSLHPIGYPMGSHGIRGDLMGSEGIPGSKGRARPGLSTIFSFIRDMATYRGEGVETLAQNC